MSTYTGFKSIRLPSENALSQQNGQPLLIFFITGNPGLVEYYRTFLTLVYGSLRDSISPPTGGTSSKISLHVHSTSLAGFETCSDRSPNALERGPYNLEQQIDHISQSLDRAHKSVQQSSKSEQPVRVILMGHSVGSYILLEVLRQRQQMARQSAATSTQDMKIIGGICLFPTVVDIVKSSNGRKFGYLFSIPYFPVLVALIVRVFVAWWPLTVLVRLIGAVNGMPEDAARVTAEFIKAPGAVRQALHLAKYEMAAITTDEWDDELWGVVKDAQQSRQKTKLFFYFGTDDHWVANETRDALIAARGSSTGGGDEDKPVMEVDKGDVPHAFCIRHNEPLSRKVSDYIQRVVQSNW